MPASFPSPSGHYRIEVSPWEARMSLWIDSPQIIECATRTVKLRFMDRLWSLDQAMWIDEHRVTLVLRKYPGHRDPSDVPVVVDCAQDSAILPDGSSVALTGLEAALDAVLRKRPLVRQSQIPG